MIRVLNLAFVCVTALVCLGLYRIAEEARVAGADLSATERAIAREHNTMTVLGAEWARLTAPARVQALAARHLDLAARPTIELSSLTALPRRNDPLAPENTIRDAKALAPPAAPVEAKPIPVALHTGA